MLQEITSTIPAVSESKQREAKSLFAAPRQIESDPPPHFYCPISQQIFFDPVINVLGRTYERESILLHMGSATRQAKDPITKQVLTNRTLIENRFALDDIELFLSHHPQQRDEQYLPVTSMQRAITQANEAEVRRLFALDTTYRFVNAHTEDEAPRSLKDLAARSTSQAIKTAFLQAESALTAMRARQAVRAAPAEQKIAVTAAVVLPEVNHYSLLTRLIAAFGVAGNAVYQGTVVEQSLVGLAGITTAQTDAEFRRASDGTTRFKLRFVNMQEQTKFREYYDRNYPGLIHSLHPQGGFIQVHLKTPEFAAQVVPNLASYYRSALSVAAASTPVALTAASADETEEIKSEANVAPRSPQSPSRASSSFLAIPRHTALLNRLVTTLGCDREAVYSGIAVEQSLVGLAGMTTEQTGAEFSRMTDDGSTRFRLRLAGGEVTQLQQYYAQQHPGFIRSITRNAAFVEVRVDTVQLYNRVADRLGAHYRALQAPVVEEAAPTPAT